MRTLPALAVLLLLAAATARSAPKPEGPEPQLKILPSPEKAGCPVEIRSQARPNASSLRVQNARPSGQAQLLYVMLQNRERRAIAAVDLTIFGITPKARTVPASGAIDGEQSWPLRLAYPLGPMGSTSSEEWIPRATALLRVRLDAITYADGARWQAPADACVFTPDPILPIAGR